MIDATETFFELNRPLVYFVYGQVFFVLGLTIALQSKRRSRLLLARRLRWLAMFGLLHGLHEWGDLFLPLQEAHVPAAAYDVLLFLHQVLLATSLACLLKFAVDLVRPLPLRWAWVRWVPLGVLGAWGLVVTAVVAEESMRAWSISASILARYFVGFPAALLAGFAMLLRSSALLAPLDDARNVRLLRAAGIALCVYAFLSGIMVPEKPGFPSTILNANVIEGALGVPLPVYRSIVALGLVLALVRLLEVFDVEVERTLVAVEEAQLLAAERARLGRDLHDRAMQSVYAAGLILGGCLEVQRREGRTRAADSVASALASLDRAVEDLRRHISELHTPPVSMRLHDGLRDRVASSAVQAVAELTFDVDLPAGLSLVPRHGGHVLAIAGEALGNIVRHSGARHVAIAAHVVADQLRLTIRDDGRGIPVDYVAGYGLENMHERARLLGGDLSIFTDPRQGTRLELTVPLRGGGR